MGERDVSDALGLTLLITVWDKTTANFNKAIINSKK
jgi:hypothetical protein